MPHGCSSIEAEDGPGGPVRVWWRHQLVRWSKSSRDRLRVPKCVNPTCARRMSGDQLGVQYCKCLQRHVRFFARCRRVNGNAANKNTAVLPKTPHCNCCKRVPNRPIRPRTAVRLKIPHSNCCKIVPNRPLRGRRGRFGTLSQLLECGIFGRTAVEADLEHLSDRCSAGSLGEGL